MISGEKRSEREGIREYLEPEKERKIKRVEGVRKKREKRGMREGIEREKESRGRGEGVRGVMEGIVGEG